MRANTLKLVLTILMMAAIGIAQTTIVTGIVLDPNNVPYRNAVVTANFINNDTKIANWNGSPLTVTTWSTNANSSASFSLPLPDLAFIGPATNVLYTFRICANSAPPPPLPSPSGQPANPCFTYTSPVCPAVGCVTGTTINITAALQAVSIPLPVSGGTITGVLTPAGSGLQGGASSGSVSLSMLTSCSSTQVLAWNGSAWVCAANGGGGGGGIPGGPPSSFQYNAAGTLGGASNFSYNAAITPNEADYGNLNNIRGVIPCAASAAPAPPCHNWQQTLGVGLTAGVVATVTLTPCPNGILGTDTIGRMVLDLGLGSQEIVTLAGSGTCTAGGASGTVQFIPARNHASNGTIGSASTGIYEALVQGNNNLRLVLNPAGAALNVSQVYPVYGSIVVPHANVIIDGAGSMLKCSTRDYCIQASTSFGPVILDKVRFSSTLDVNGWPIASTQCTSGVTTITTTSTHGIIVGDVVDVQWTDNHHYWGGSVSTNTQVTAVTSTTVSYPDSACASTPIALATTPGYINIVNATFLAANQEDATLSQYDGNPTAYTGHFNNGIVVLNDQSFVVTKYNCCDLHGDPPSVNLCNFTNQYCGWAIYAPGPFVNAAVLNVSDSNLSLGCAGNGIGYFAGNTLNVHNTVIQGFNQVGIFTGNERGGFGPTTTDNLYQEIGSCQNPFYPASVTTTTAGIINVGTPLTWNGGEGPAGFSPTFATGGPTAFFWHVVVHDSVLGTSAPFLIGSGNPSGAVTVYFPRVTGTNTVTYDVIRSTDAANTPTTASCTGGSATACGSVSIGQAQCSGLICSFADNSTNATAAYTVVDPPTYAPFLWFWPGVFVAEASNADSAMASIPSCSGYISARGRYLGTNVVSNIGSVYPCMFTELQSSGGQGNINGWTSSLEGAGPNQPATLMGEQGQLLGGPYKGRFNFHRNAGTLVPIGDLFTFVDSNPAKTAANSLKRPTMDAADMGIGNDVANAALNATGMALRAPASITSYINGIPGVAPFQERLNISLKEFNIPTQFDQSIQALVGCNGCSPLINGGTQISDLFQRAGPALGANYTTLDGGMSIASNSVYVSSLGGDTHAWVYYSGASFANDQYAQMTFNPSTNSIVMCVRMTTSMPISAYCFGAGGGAQSISKYIAGTGTGLYSAGALAVGTIVKLQVVGSTLTLYENGTLITTVTDSAIASGAVGFGGYNAAGPTLGTMTNLYAGNVQWTSSVPITVPRTTLTPVVFSALPACVSALEGSTAAVTDSTTATWGATITGGGANHVMAYCDNTNWTVAAK